MVSWILIGIVIIAIFIVSRFIHFRHWKHRVSAIALILLLFFLYASFIGVVNSADIDLKTPAGVLKAGKVYLSWFGQAFSNFKTLTGNAIHMKWLPGNQSLSFPN